MTRAISNKSMYKIIALVSAGLFVLLSYLVYFQNIFILSTNDYFYTVTVNSGLYDYHNFWRFVTTFGGSGVLVFGTLCTALYSYFHSRNYQEAKTYLVAMLLGGLSVYAVKYLTAFERPTGLFSIEETFSFPSGHTALSAIFAIVTGYYFVRDKRKRHKKLVLISIGSYVLLIILSRLMLGEHWFIDIVGGLLLAISISTATVLYFKSKKTLT